MVKYVTYNCFWFVYFHVVGIVNRSDVDTGDKLFYLAHLELWMLLLQNYNKINTLTNTITEK